MMTPRLMMIAEHIKGETTADIGTDHAYVPIYLVEQNKIKSAVATDIKKGPLNIAKANVEKYHLCDKIELRLGSGLSPVAEKEVDSYILAGMGGDMIQSILETDEKKARSADMLLLQPMNAQADLRKWLIQNHFSILKEDIAIEGFKVYNLIVIKSGKTTQFKHELDFHLPPYLYGHPFFKELKAKKKREFTKIKTGLEQAVCQDEKQLEKYSKLLLALERI